MSDEFKTCPICKLENQEILAERDYGDKVTYDCRRCGEFTISRTAESVLSGQSIAKKLSGWVRERNLLGVDIPMLDTSFIENIVKTLPKYGPSEKQFKLLKALELLTDFPGKEIEIHPICDTSLAWASNETELRYYISSLIERGLIDNNPNGVRSIGRAEFLLVISPRGWDYLDSYELDLEAKDQAFVAMSFDPALNSIYENAIAPAIESTGYKPYRVDQRPHNDKIDAKIVAEILNSRFVVADVTQQKNGVYYEAGFAQGKGIPVIWSVKKEDLGEVHFDTRQYNHIPWESEAHLKSELESYILAIIGAK
jgi:hypothetical protein